MATTTVLMDVGNNAFVVGSAQDEKFVHPAVTVTQSSPPDTPLPPTYPTLQGVGEPTDEDQEKHEPTVPVPSDPTPTLPPNSPQTSTPTRIWAKARPITSLLFLYAFSLVFCLLFCSFVYVVLLKGRVETPGVYWDAVKTNYVVSVLSQFSAILTAAAIKAVLGVLRTALVHRPNGSSFATWVGLGGSDWWTVLQVAAVEGFLNFWCDLRVSLPILMLGFGSIIKFNADFGYYFIASNTMMDVYSGLIKPDLRVLNGWISAADTAMYFLTWASSLLTNPMFAVEFPMANCTGECRSMILPGGLTTARQYKPWLNESVYFGQFSNIDTIRISNATGFVIKYEEPEKNTNITFELSTECVYTGEQVNNGLQFCARQAGDSILVGWSACPKNLLDKSSCNNITSWRDLPFNSVTLMTLYTLPTQTSYSLESQSIIDIVPLLPKPVPAPLSAAEYLEIVSRVLVPSTSRVAENTTDANNANINSLIYSTTWMHRTFRKSFPSDKSSPTSYLHNILAIPLQFAVTATSFANYTAAERGLESFELFTLPEEMRTVATGGWASSRLKILPWAGCLFIAADLVVHLAMAGGIAWVLLRKRGIDGSMPLERGAVKELADVREAGRLTVAGYVDHGDDCEGGKERWYRRSWKWFTWLRKGRRPRQVEEWDPSERVLLEFANDGTVAEDLASWKVAWRYRMVSMVGTGRSTL